MANDEKKLDQEFIDEVNAGYLLGKYAPEFWDLIVQSTGNSKVLAAMKQGKELFDKETGPIPLPSWLKKDALEKQKDTNKSKDDIEPDR